MRDLDSDKVPRSVVVLGAGMVGTSCALELQRRGWGVTLWDMTGPGSGTSYGNAGLIARSSIVPMNNPGLWKALPGLLGNQSPKLRFSWRYLMRNARWATGFLANARRDVCDETATALNDLIQLSTREHLRLTREANITSRVRDTGWLFLYRSEAGFAASQSLRDVLSRYEIRADTLSADEIAALEPDLLPVFARALWVRDAYSLDRPDRVVQAYADLLIRRGGSLAQDKLVGLRRSGSSWECMAQGGRTERASAVVVALGPWSKAVLEDQLGLSVPLGLERGYHMHYASHGRLGRPVYDVDRGYLLGSMESGFRLTTGVDLNDQDAPMRLAQLTLAEQSAREAFPLGERLSDTPWMGCRPTLPDSRPAIGACPGHPGIWLAFGHQHIGVSTGPGTAAVLGALMDEQASPIPAKPFQPQRCIR